MAETLSNEEIVERVRSGETFMNKFARKDRNACKKFLDSTNAQFAVSGEEDEDEGEGMPQDNAEGQYNPVMVNILTKVASIGMFDPDWHMATEDQSLRGIPFPGDPGAMVRDLYRGMWRRFKWTREMQYVLQKRAVAGMGFLYTLHQEGVGPVLEAEDSWNVIIDPHVRRWHKMRWAGRRIFLPRAEAVERYGEVYFKAGKEMPFSEAEEWDRYPADTERLYVYWDMNEEIVVHDDEVIFRAENRYGRVPLRVFEGDINPLSQFALGDFDIVTGLQVGLADGYDMLNNNARHGGSVGWYRPEGFDKADQDALRNGRPQGFIAVDGMRGEEALGFTRSEPFNPTILEMINLCQRGIDATQGVSQFQRGVLDESLKFATEGVLLANQGGARGGQSKSEYEQFLEDVSWDIQDLLLRFGEPQSDAEWLLHEALLMVNDIQIHPGSTTYKDPSITQQAMLQLLQALAPLAPMIGLDLRELVIRVLKAFGIYDAERLLPSPEVAQQMQMQQMMMMQQQQGMGQPGMAPPGGMQR